MGLLVIRLGSEGSAPHEIRNLKASLVVHEMHDMEDWDRIDAVLAELKDGKGNRRHGARLIAALKKLLGPDVDERRGFHLWLAAVHEEPPYDESTLTQIAELVAEQQHLIRDMLPYGSRIAA